MLLLPIPWIASAAGLGTLAVLSSLGQPFRAEIALAAQKDEFATLSSRIASPDAYKQANFQYNPALAGLHLAVRQRPNGRAYIEITSSRPIDEPFIDLLIEVNWDSARIIRGYTALLDPPGFGPIPVTSARVAAAAGQPVAEAQGANGEITFRIDSKTSGRRAENIARSLKGRSFHSDTANHGTMRSMSYRIHVLQEKSLLQTKAIAELVARIALMEQTVKDLQHFLELRLQGAVPAKSPAVVKPVAQSPEATKSTVVAEVKPASAPADIKKDAPQNASLKEEKKPAAPASPEKPNSIIVPPPPHESDFADTVLGSQLFYLAAGGSVILLGGLAFFWMRRRRQSQAMTPEDVLNRLLARDAGRADLQIKLLERYASRGDKAAFETAASAFNKLTGGHGDDWIKVATMGYALDPDNPLYAAGRNEVTATSATDEVM